MSKPFFTKSKMIIAGYVDAAGIGRRLFILPGEVSLFYLNQKERSAEVIIVVGNEPLERTEVSQTAKARRLSRFQFSKEDQIKLASLILNEAGCNWCKER